MYTEPEIEPIGRFSRHEADEIVNHCKRAYQAELEETFDGLKNAPAPAQDKYYEFIGRLKSYLETDLNSQTEKQESHD